MNTTELKKLAEAATPGPWHLDDCGYMFIISKPGDGYITRNVCRMDSSTMSAFSQKANAAYIAAANPDAILKLLAINAELVEALKKISAIELKEFGADWEEIEEAQDIAYATLAKAEGGEL